MKKIIKSRIVPATLISLFIFLCPLLQGQDFGSITELPLIPDNVISKRISSYDVTGGNNDRFENIRDGETRTLAEISGPGVISHIWITIAPEPERLSRNDIILRIYWDGNDYPSVESPIGPFFGQGWNESYPFQSMLLTANPVDGRAMVSYFKMPFKKGAKIEIENQTGSVISAFYYYVDYYETVVPDNIGYFHAWYNHRITQAPASGENEWGILSDEPGFNPEGTENYLIMETEGKGMFVGVNYYVNNPTTIWYGEGDDMFYIDGSQLPTLNGTGTEDYFNTSWCPNSSFSHPYYGYPRMNGTMGWLGRTHLYRFHIQDPIFFDRSLKFSIEHGHNNCLTLDLASVAYWYLDKPARIKSIPDKAGRQFMPEINAVDIHRWRDAWRKANGNKSDLWGNE